MRILLLALVLLSSMGCSARRRAEDTIVRRIKFRGTAHHLFSAHNNNALRSQMTHQDSAIGLLGPFSFAVQPVLLDERLLAWDERPIEVYLAHHGWFDADLVRWEIKQKRKKRRHKQAVVDVIGHVQLGPVTRWDADTPTLSWDGPPILSDRAVKKLVAPRPGRRFRLYDVELAQADLTRAMLEQSYALGTVSADVEVRPDDQSARLALTLATGRPHVIGEVSVEGAETIAEHRIVNNVLLPRGEPFDAATMDQARDHLYSTGAFRQVAVVPGEADSGDLPVRIRVAEGLPRQVQLGSSIGYEGAFFVPRGAFVWSNDNVRGRLRHLEIGTSLGVGYTAGESPIPLFRLWTQRDAPRFIAPRLSWSVRGEAENDLFEYVIPRLRAETGISWSWRISRLFTVSGGPSVGVTSLLTGGTANDERLTAMALGVGVPNPYGYSAVDAQVAFTPSHERDSRRHGLEVVLSGRNAWVPNGPVQRVGLDIQGFLAPHGPVLGRPIQLSGRLKGEQVFGEDVIWPERLFLGGSTTLRSFRSAGVGPYDCICAERDVYGLRRLYLPRGGSRSVFATGEVQLHRVLLRELALTLFAEAGALDDRLRYGVGTGVRYDTPLGPFRLDVATRPIWPEDVGPDFGVASSENGVYVGCEDPQRRPFDLLSEFGRRQPLERSLPVLNVVLSLGLP